MKKFIVPAYTFTPGAAGVGTVDLSAIAGFEMKRLAAIINQTRGVIIYSTASALKGFTAEAAGVITLQTSTVGHNAGDRLQIVYEDPADDVNTATMITHLSQIETAVEAIQALDFATEAKQDAAIVHLAAIETAVEAIQALDFATEAKQDAAIVHLAQIEAAVEAIQVLDFATEAKQDAAIVHLAAIETAVEAIQALDFATEAKQDTQITHLAAIETAVEAIELIDFATEAKQDTQITHLAAIETAVEAVEDGVGDPTDAKELDPDAASASLVSLLRGILEGVQGITPGGGGLPVPTSTVLDDSYTVAGGEVVRAKPLSPSCTVDGVEVFLEPLNPLIQQANASGSGACYVPKGFTGKSVSSASATVKTVCQLSCDNVVAPTSMPMTPTTASGVAQTVYWKNGVPQGFTSQSSTAFLKFVEAYEIRISSNTATTWSFYEANLYEITVPAGTVLAGGNWILEKYTV